MVPHEVVNFRRAGAVHLTDIVTSRQTFSSGCISESIQSGQADASGMPWFSIDSSSEESLAWCSCGPLALLLVSRLLFCPGLKDCSSPFRPHGGIMFIQGIHCKTCSLRCPEKSFKSRHNYSNPFVR